MKTRLLWALILSVGCTALYIGIARPEVSTLPKRVRDAIETDPATRPPVLLPPLVVSESRLPAAAVEFEESLEPSPAVPSQDQAADAPAAGFVRKAQSPWPLVEGGDLPPGTR